MDTDDVRTWFSGIATLIGLWLVASPFVLGAPRLLQWSNVSVGAAVAVLAAFGTYRLYDRAAFNQYAAGLAGLGGVWALLSPFALGASGPLLWSNVVAGALVVLAFGYGLYVDPDVSSRSGAPTA